VRVLVLEDEPALREHLARRLRNSGFVVDEAADGIEGEYASLTLACRAGPDSM